MGAGFGMMMPGMIQQAMQAGAAPSSPGPAPATGITGAPIIAGAAAGAAGAVAGGGMDFGDLAPVAADPKQLVRAAAEANSYAVEEAGNSWLITVPVGALRKQVVHVEFGTKDDQGHEMVNYWSVCGPVSPQNALALLRYNTSILHGAFAVRSVTGAEMVVLQANQLAETLDTLEVSRTLAAIAWQADKAEQKMVGSDEF